MALGMICAVNLIRAVDEGAVGRGGGLAARREGLSEEAIGGVVVPVLDHNDAISVIWNGLALLLFFGEDDQGPKETV